MCRTLPDFPMLNVRYDDEANVIHRSGAVHMGMATQTDNGLSLAVIRDAQDRSVWDLAKEIARLAAATRAGKASREELSGSTITISSLGPMGGLVDRQSTSLNTSNSCTDRIPTSALKNK